ncbi:succinyl-CoA synthetase-like protein [Stachybotrys elegans]|uniref:Succinyl-CoA synthetase-like protein n=1 Tax=Stachybotrys elegans TaxID=80388 RepID=A0A8K0WT62_9HYPO|nr:succinyl-CoA synthetase-like protein [Stachybotrys elegans]
MTTSANREKWALSLLIDRENYYPSLLVQGHVSATDNGPRDTEQNKYLIRYSAGITQDILDRTSARLGLSPQASNDLGMILTGMYSIFQEKDATRIDISLERSETGGLYCASSVFEFDNAAEKRQPEIFALRDKSQDVMEEVEADKYGLVYVRMEGNIGNVVNGAGLAMATNDAIGFYGGASANFLDAGGQATKETMLQAFRIVLGDERVGAIMVNVYGGITKCDMIAESVIAAATELGPLTVPVVVRLQGTNSEKGLQLIQEADMGLHVEADFGKAAELVVRLAK